MEWRFWITWRINYISDVQDYLIIFKENNVEKTDNSSITKYVKEIWNRITFKRNIGYYVELLTAVTMKLRGSTRSKITKDKNVRNLAQCGKNVVKNLEITEVVLAHFNIVNNNYQQDSRVLYIFIPNKLFGQLLDISSKYFTFLTLFHLEFSYIEVWFTDPNCKPVEIQGKINITLVIN